MSENANDRRDPEAAEDAAGPATTAASAGDSAASSGSDPVMPPRPPLPAGWPVAAPSPRPPHPSAQPGRPAPSVAYPAASSSVGAPYGTAFGSGAAPVSTTQPTLRLPAENREESPKRAASAGRALGLIVAAALVGGASGLGGAWAGISMWGQSDASTPAGPTTITVNDTDDVNITSAVAAKVTPSVVTISASAETAGGSGSGVVLTEDGYILTNTHVVTLDGQTGDPTLRVTTWDGRAYDAKIVGTDPTYDLAVIKLEDASNLTPIEWGDSRNLNVGDETIAVGAPLGLSNTVTTGIVSALNRSIQVASSAAPEEQPGSDGDGDSPFFFDFGEGTRPPGSGAGSIAIAVIQTDAAINPGNSGGALVDSEGRLIGINVAIASAGSSTGGSQGSIGVGFAIPSEIAKRVADELVADGTATHGLLGATVQPVPTSADIAGSYIAEVTPGGPAQEAGLRAGDIVTQFNGLPIATWTDLTAQVRALAAGSETTLTYVRNGESHTIDVTLGTYEP